MTRLLAAACACCFGLPLLVLLSFAGAPDAAARPAGSVAVLGAGYVTATDASQVRDVPTALRPAFLLAAHRYALPPALLAAVGKVESGFDPAAVGPPVPGGPAEGMMQFLPSSWQLFNVIPGATPYDPG
ncbi:MAG TPA: transglycosylase SLT domain-containing protein, partial [Mycobacteriales bacterium]|nr:transglycosylase SLT domain-containing protein [Mycobacteriales bacterium]